MSNYVSYVNIAIRVYTLTLMWSKSVMFMAGSVRQLIKINFLPSMLLFLKIIYSLNKKKLRIFFVIFMSQTNITQIFWKNSRAIFRKGSNVRRNTIRRNHYSGPGLEFLKSGKNTKSTPWYWYGIGHFGWKITLLPLC